MFKFKKFSDERIRHYTNPGKAEKIIYKKVEKRGQEPELVEIGRDNLQEQINSWRDSCDIKKLIEKYQMLGDESILNQRKGFYADVTDLPTNLIDMNNITSQAKDMFENLNKKYKSQFNSFDEFMNVLIGGKNVTESSSNSVNTNDDVNNSSNGDDVSHE